MSDFLYAVTSAETTKIFGNTGRVIDGLYYLTSVFPAIRALTNAFNTPSHSIKGLEKSLKELLNALNTSSLDADQSFVLLNQVKEQIQLIRNDPEGNNFRNYSLFKFFDAYTEPLTTLHREIEEYSFSSSSPLSLVPYIEKAINLIEGEINSQTGLLRSLCQKTSNFVKKQWFSENAPCSTNYLKPSPFTQLLHVIKLAKGQKDFSIYGTVYKHLEEIEHTYPQFQGIKAFIEDKKNDQRLNENIEIHLYEFIFHRSKGLPLFSETFELYSIKHGFFYDGPIPFGVLLKSVELALEIQDFNQFIETFYTEKSLDKVYKIFRFLDFVKAHSDALEVKPFAFNLCKQLDKNLALIQESYSEELDESQKRTIQHIRALIYQNDFFLNGEKWNGVLTQLKKIFYEGSFLKILGGKNDLQSPLPELRQFKSKAAIQLFKTKQEASKRQFENDFSKIEKEARLLSQHIAMRSTFAFFSNRYRIDSQTSETLFESILTEVELHPYNGSQKELEKREAVFREKIDAMVNKHSLFNLKLLQWIVFKYISHFTNNLTQLLVDHQKAALLQLPKPSSKNYTTLIECTNQGVLSLLFAQNACPENAMKGKKIAKESVEALTDKVVNTFIVPSIFPNHTSNKVAFVFNRVVQFFINRMIHLLVMQPDQLVTDTLEKIEETLYGVNYVHPYLDQFLLEKIEEFEKTLNDDPIKTLDQTASLPKGSRENAAASELSRNLLALLRKKQSGPLTDMSPSFFEQFNDQITKWIDDGVIQEMLSELIISTNKELMQKETLSGLTLNVLKNANASLKKGKIASLEEFEKEHELDASEDLETRFEIYEAALQRQHYETEQKLYKAIERVLNTMVEKDVKGKVSALKDRKEPQDALLDYTQWINQHFNLKSTDPKKDTFYIHQMQTVCEQLFLSSENNNDIKPLLEKMERIHNGLFIEWENHLERLEKIQTLDPSKLNLEIKELYQITSDLMGPLKKVQECLLKKDYKQLLETMQLLKNKAKNCQHNLMQLNPLQKKESPSFPSQLLDKVVEQGGTEKVTDYLVSHVFMPLAEKAVQTYKKPEYFIEIVKFGLSPRLQQELSFRA